jgi:putative sigma-54 modulation protein
VRRRRATAEHLAARRIRGVTEGYEAEVAVRTIVKGKNLDVHPDDRRYAETKFRRLERILDDRTDAIIEFSVERHRSIVDSHIVEATLVIDGKPVRGVASGLTHRAAVDVLVDRLERRSVALKEKPRERQRPARAARATPAAGPALESEAGAEEEDGSPAIVKIKRFAIEPMFDEDAVARMEELGHQFFVFVNAENERLCVLYRRRDGDYGVIEPVVGGEYSTNGRGAGHARRARSVASRA